MVRHSPLFWGRRILEVYASVKVQAVQFRSVGQTAGMEGRKNVLMYVRVSAVERKGMGRGASRFIKRD